MSRRAVLADRPEVFRVPDRRGTYALLLDYREAARKIRIGRRGEMRLDPARYVYVGSAAGPGGLRGRLRHHMRDPARPHWHIDYLRMHCELAGAWLAEDTRVLEHSWSRALTALDCAALPLNGFGASDCRSCPAHLVAFPPGLPRERIGRALKAVGPSCIYLDRPSLQSGLG